MDTRHFKLSGHHLFNLVEGYSDSYRRLEKAMRESKTKVNGAKQRTYTDIDVAHTIALYLNVVSSPDNTIEIVNGIDDHCRRCGNYDGAGCAWYSEANMMLEDRRSLADFFPGLRVGDVVRISDIIPCDIAIQYESVVSKIPLPLQP